MIIATEESKFGRLTIGEEYKSAAKRSDLAFGLQQKF